MRDMVNSGMPSVARDELSRVIKNFISSPRSVRRTRLTGSPLMGLRCILVALAALKWLLMCFIPTQYTKGRVLYILDYMGISLRKHIVQVGEPVLRAQSKPVPKKDIGTPALHKLILDMKKALASEENGVAIAAPQLGHALRMFVVAGHVFAPDTEEDESDPLPQPDRVFINPEIIRQSRKQENMSEGCLSVRGQYGTVRRHTKCSIRAHDEQGKELVYHGSGLLAQIFQHEVDHLDGILFIDKASDLDYDG
jgi:peptide deformylase